MRRMLTVRTVCDLLLAAWLGLIGCRAAHAAEGPVTLEPADGKITVKIGGELLTEYVYQGHAKPILYPVIGPGGQPMTRNYPMREEVDNEARDHPHHKSLWYTHGNVNGIDFWSEVPRREGQAFGKIRQVGEPETKDGRRGRLTTRNEWVAPDGEVQLTDTRRLLFGTHRGDPFIEFQITLHASHGDVTFADTKEGTMGIRIHPLLRLQTDERRGNHTARGSAVNSEGVEGKAVWGKRAKWVDYWAPFGDRTLGIAIFDHPSNPRHPTWWHARHYGLVAANPFGIHDFTRRENPDVSDSAGDMKIESGESATFRYLFLFHEGDAERADIAQRYDQWSSRR